VGVLPLYLDIRRGSRDEFTEVLPSYEAKVALLAEASCEVVHVGGAPPFMIQGLDAERRMIESWENRYRVALFTSGQNHVAALRALGAKSMIGASYFPGEINRAFAKYFEDAGFDVRGMDGIETPFDKAQELSAERVYAHIKKNFLARGGADAVYMLGSGWRTLSIVETLERDLRVPVVHPAPARVWEFQKRLRINAPRSGYGALLAALPSLPRS
jgi:maleate isomerase